MKDRERVEMTTTITMAEENEKTLPIEVAPTPQFTERGIRLESTVGIASLTNAGIPIVI